MGDIVVEPGASRPSLPMENDMVCHMAERELQAVQDGQEFTGRKGGGWTWRANPAHRERRECRAGTGTATATQIEEVTYGMADDGEDDRGV